MIFLRVFNIIVLQGLLFCAEKDGADHDATSAKLVTFRSVDFGLHADKRGASIKARSLQIYLKDLEFFAEIQARKVVSFSEVVTLAHKIYGGALWELWHKIFGALYDERRIGIDCSKREIIWGKPAVAPAQELIEVAIMRVYEDDVSVLRSDLVLILYEAGYRDYCYKSIEAKLNVLMAMGFIQKYHFGLGGHTKFIRRIETYWSDVCTKSHKQALELYKGVPSDDIEKVYQMIYIKKHDIRTALQRHMMCNHGEAFGLGVFRQDHILKHILSKKGQPFSLNEISTCVPGDSVLPNGSLSEVARLVFLGKIKGSYDWKCGTCQFVEGESVPEGDRDETACDELIFFQNLHEYITVDRALLMTYLCGRRTYAQNILILCKKAFALVGFDVTGMRAASPHVEKFLTDHESIPPTWEWSQDLMVEGFDLLVSYEHSTLNVLFDMHNRGVLKKVQQFVEGLRPSSRLESKNAESIQAKMRQFLGERPRKLSCLVRKIEYLGTVHDMTWDAVCAAVLPFVSSFYYDEEQQEFTWLEHPRFMQKFPANKDTSCAAYICSKHPKITLRGLAVMLTYLGFDISLHRARLILSALNILGLVPESNKHTASCTGRCQQAMEVIISGKKNLLEADSETLDVYKGLTNYDWQSICFAFELRGQKHLAAVTRQRRADFNRCVNIAQRGILGKVRRGAHHDQSAPVRKVCRSAHHDQSAPVRKVCRSAHCAQSSIVQESSGSLQSVPMPTEGLNLLMEVSLLQSSLPSFQNMDVLLEAAANVEGPNDSPQGERLEESDGV